MTRIVVIGGVAAGMSAASQAKRRQPQAEVVALERGPYVSYGACGIPYNLEDPRRNIEDLIVISEDRFRNERGIDVRTRHEVQRIDSKSRCVYARDLDRHSNYALAYDKLIVATGARAFHPPFSGMELPGVFLLRELSDGAAIKRHLEQEHPASAVIIGGGYIGMEMADVLRGRGLAVTVLERLEQLTPGFDPEIAGRVRQEVEAHGVTVSTGVDVGAIVNTDGRLAVQTDNGPVPADMVLVSVGVRPNAALADEAGIKLGASGAIAVDEGMRTSVEDIFAAGDCAEAYHRVLKRPVYIPLGTTANKQGKVAGANAAGGDLRFAGIVGTAAFKVFGMEVGRTGLGRSDIEHEGLDAVTAVSVHKSRGHHYPGSQDITTIVFAERGSGRLLGAQMVGGDTVAKRIDVFATALHAQMTVADVAGLDLSYAPPFAPVYDPVLIAASVALKELKR